MAGLRLANDRSPLGMDRDRERGGRSTDSLLHPASADVHLELRARRLGYPRARPFASPADSCCGLGGFVLCDVDLSDTYVLEFDRDTGCAVEFGFGPADLGK